MALTRVRAKGIDYTSSTLTDTSNSGSVTLDFDTYVNFVLTFTGNVTLANPSTENVGQAGVIVCIQDGTGSRTLTLGTDYESAGGSGITNQYSLMAADVNQDQLINVLDVVAIVSSVVNQVDLGTIEV